MKTLAVILTILFSFTAFAVDKEKTVTLNVDGMHCQSCADKVEGALKKVDGVSSAKVMLAEKKATVTFASNSNTSSKNLIAAVSDAGFSAAEGTVPAKSEMKKKSKTDAEGCATDCCDGEHNKKEVKKAKGKKS